MGKKSTGSEISVEKIVQWLCTNCGHIHIGKTAPVKCPVCDHPKEYFQIKAINY